MSWVHFSIVDEVELVGTVSVFNDPVQCNEGLTACVEVASPQGAKIENTKILKVRLTRRLTIYNFTSATRFEFAHSRGRLLFRFYPPPASLDPLKNRFCLLAGELT